MLRIVAADEPAIRDIEVARPRIVGKDAHADVFEPAALHGQAFRARDELRACLDRDLRVPERDAFEVLVVGGPDVEEIELVPAVDHDLAVAGSLDDGRLLGRALARQVVGPFEFRRRVDRRLVAG